MGKAYYKRNTEEILEFGRRFDKYHSMFREYVATSKRGAIRSSLDRGTIYDPTDILPAEMLNLLGSGNSPQSYSYGPEEGDSSVRQLIAKVENKKYGTSYTENNIAMMPGAWAGLEVAIKEVCDFQGGRSEGSVAIIGPTLYQMFYSPIAHCGISMQAFDFVVPGAPHVPTSMDDLEELFATKPKAIVITNPNNPDGHYIEASLLKQIIDRSREEDIYIILDEIQHCFTNTNAAGLNYGSWIAQPHIIRVDSPSKRYGLANLRTGWMIAHPDILYGKSGETNRLNGTVGRMSGLMGNAPRIGNKLLYEISRQELESPDHKPHFLAVVEETARRRLEYTIKHLESIDSVSDIIVPGACVNVTVGIDYQGDDMILARQLMKAGTLLMPASGYGYNNEPPYLRITFWEKEKRIDHAMNVLKEVASTVR